MKNKSFLLLINKYFFFVFSLSLILTANMPAMAKSFYTIERKFEPHNSPDYLISSSNLIQGSSRKNMQGGYAKADVTFYRNGYMVIEARAKAENHFEGVKSAVFVVGRDDRGRKLFVSPAFRIDTVCGRMDVCSSNVTNNFSHSIPSNLAAYVHNVDVYVDNRGQVGNAVRQISKAIREGYDLFQDLPAPVRAAILSSLGG